MLSILFYKYFLCPFCLPYIAVPLPLLQASLHTKIQQGTGAPHSFQSQILLVAVNLTNSLRILSLNKAVGSIPGNNVYLRLQNTTCMPSAEGDT